MVPCFTCCIVYFMEVDSFLRLVTGDIKPLNWMFLGGTPQEPAKTVITEFWMS